MHLFLTGLARSRRPDAVNGLALLVPFGVLLFCGVVVDQLYHILRKLYSVPEALLGMAEDGGEMIAITAVVALAAALAKLGTRDQAGRLPE